MTVIFSPWRAVVRGSILLIVVALVSTSNNPSYAVKNNLPLPCNSIPEAFKFECGDGTCILGHGFIYSRVCDAYIDCYTGRDEFNCRKEHTRWCDEDSPHKSLFQCNDGMCISANWRNDGDLDCIDQSDETENDL